MHCSSLRILKGLFFTVFLFTTFQTSGQVNNSVFIRLVNPAKDSSAVTASRQFIIGSTCTSCSLRINEQDVKVYPTGAFAFEINLREGDTLFNIRASNTDGKLLDRTIKYSFTPLPKPTPVDSFSIEKIFEIFSV